MQKPIYNGRRQISGRDFWGMKEESPRSTRELLEMVDLFIILMVVMVSQVSTPQTVHFKYARFIVYQLHLSKAVF